MTFQYKGCHFFYPGSILILNFEIMIMITRVRTVHPVKSVIVTVIYLSQLMVRTGIYGAIRKAAVQRSASDRNNLRGRSSH